MALRAYVHRRVGQPDTPVRKRGDVVSVHLSERAVPGDRCKSGYLILEDWDDESLETQMRAAGQTMWAYPYAEYDEEGRMTRMSRRFVDFDDLPEALSDGANTRSVLQPISSETVRNAVKERGA